jgi:hypothetical protein
MATAATELCRINPSSGDAPQLRSYSAEQIRAMNNEGQLVVELHGGCVSEY